MTQTTAVSSWAYSGENVIVVTGLPGRGKTLLALWLFDQIVRQGRPGFVAGVRGVKLKDGWELLEDRAKWHECPPGSVVLIDEGQECFRPAGSGAAVPEHIAKMERVRHSGITLIITTQHPTLLHGNVRKLTQAHLHLVRKFGAESATVYKWDMVADVATRSALLSAVKSAARTQIWSYPKDVYSWYDSAEVHTVQKRFPWQRAFVYAVPFVVVGLLFVGYQAMSKLMNAPTEIGKKGQGTPAEHAAAASVPSAPAGTSGASVKTTEQWLAERTPRISGLAHTAPAFDQVTKPAHAPYPAACVVMHGECRCYSEQATRLDTPDMLCRQIVDRGFYVEWDTQLARSSPQGRQDERRVSDERPAAPPAERPLETQRGAMIADGGSFSGIPPLGR